jgi:hypothetical protein
MRPNWIMLLPLWVVCISPSIAAQQELPASAVIKKSVNAVGYRVGKSTKMDLKGFNPVEDNNTPAGRQKKRWVEIVVSGDIIGQKIGS